LTLAIVGLIVYGSLFPFVFYDRGSLGDAVRYLLATPTAWTDRGDVLSNILLYLPLGLFGARALENLPAASRVLVMAILGGALSTGIEITQYFDLSRASELSDVTTNFVGVMAGALIETAARAWLRRVEWRPFAIILIVAQLGAWLYPYVPSFRPHVALDARYFDAIGVYRQTVFWLAIAMLLEELVGATKSLLKNGTDRSAHARSTAHNHQVTDGDRVVCPLFQQASRARLAAPAIAVFVILARLAIPGAAMTGNDLAGAVLGVLAWVFVLSKMHSRALIVSGLFAGFVIVDALRPFTFLPSPREFGWTPFLSFIDGPRGNASRVFLEKTFTYGSLLWLFTRSGLAWLPATLSAASLVFVLRIIQVWLPGRSAEITDVLMVLILAAVMKVVAR
jgi:VanZ family protein